MYETIYIQETTGMTVNLNSEIKLKSVKELIPYIRNSRTHDDNQVAQICASIKEFGFTNPILIDDDNSIIAGHGRLLASQKLGLDKVPTINLGYLSEDQKKAYVIADNKLALNAGWDIDMLKVEIETLKELDFNLDLLGFDNEELDSILAEMTEGKTDEDDIPEIKKDSVSKAGDIWMLGKHRLLVGDSTDINNVDKLLDGSKPDLIFTDPPYGIDYQDTKGKHKKIEGDDSLSNIDELVNISLSYDAPIYICCNWQCYSTFEKAMADYGKSPKSCIVWDKKVRVQNLDKFYKRHEFILYYGEFGGQKTLDGDVWICDREVRKEHPTAKPVELCEKAINYSSKPENIVMDLYLGSGATLIACEKSSRRCYGMELDPCYADVIIKRWQDFTGFNAELLDTNNSETKPLTFNQLLKERDN